MFSGKIDSSSGSGEEFSPFIVFRTIGVPGGERFGVGAVDKAGVSVDCLDYRHHALVLVTVLAGRGRYIDDDKNSWPVTAGCSFIRFKNRPHSLLIEPESGWKELFIELGNSLAAVLERAGVVNPEQPVIAGTTITAATVERFMRLGEKFNTLADSGLTMLLPEILDLALLLAGGDARSGTGGSRRLQLLEAACSMLGDFSRDGGVREFCRRHGVGYENFRKIFKSQFGLSPHQYRLRRRIDAACALLLHPEISVAEVAGRLGYSSPYEFSAQFKRYLGVAPSVWRPRRMAAVSTSEPISRKTSR